MNSSDTEKFKAEVRHLLGLFLRWQEYIFTQNLISSLISHRLLMGVDLCSFPGFNFASFNSS